MSTAPDRTPLIDVPFQVYPAIDLLAGQAVRLLKGDYEQVTTYDTNPVRQAERWFVAGATWLHLVDLDAAKTGEPVNHRAIRDIVQVAADFGALVQVGGGVRSLNQIAALRELGVRRCIVGTKALDVKWVEEAVREFGWESLVIGLDGRQGKLAVRGWVEQTEVSLTELAVELVGVGARLALVTDVERDGALVGPNLDLPREITAKSGMACIASGGVHTIDDVRFAYEAGLAGAITGRALYDGTLDLALATRLVKEWNQGAD